MLWPIFGASNQLLAALTLMTLALYFFAQKRPVWPLVIPMVLVMSVAGLALFTKLQEFLDAQIPAIQIYAITFILIAIYWVKHMEQVYWYCLAYAAQLYGVLVHAACLMSTHCHEVITDVRGEYPDFLETLHRNLALCTKAYRGWPEEVFNKRSTGVHALLTPEAMMESIAYLIANPAEAGALSRAPCSRPTDALSSRPPSCPTVTFHLIHPSHSHAYRRQKRVPTPLAPTPTRFKEQQWGFGTNRNGEQAIYEVRHLDALPGRWQ